jgi:voltage-gated potassium channel
VRIPRNLQVGLFSLATVIVVGTIGFVVIGDISFGDAAYLTVVTVTTLGFVFLNEPLTGPEKFWLVVVLLSGMGAAIYTVTAMMEYGFEIVVGSDYRRQKKMNKEISLVTDHVIICGYGRVGATAAASLRRGDTPCVIIEVKPKAVDRAIDDGMLVVEGDATRDETLIEAGIATAQSVIASVASSSDNLVITLSAKAIRKDISVTARAVDHETEKKLTLAGADAVVTPERVGGDRMAALSTQPGLAEFIETVVRDTATELRIKRFIVSDTSDVVGQSLSQIDLRKDSGAMVIGVCAEGEPMRVNPDPSQPFRPGDAVFGIGSENQLVHLQDILGAR